MNVSRALFNRSIASRQFMKKNFSTIDKETPSNFKQYFPIVGVFVGLSALSFQIVFLYPWHEIISNDFHALEEVTKRIEIQEEKLSEKLDLLMIIENEVKLKEKRILISEQQILLKLEEIIQCEKARKS
mmetsp:Transcript_36037/g.34104  ORF Transcript_36037/g.34104 Transcript_36037/m.34104 type:complete len:129 (+) Transcript_36037:109-495(+)